MNKIKIITRLGITLILLAALTFLTQTWFEIFEISVFSKLMITFGVLGGALFLGGILYYEYATDKIGKDKNLLS